MALSLFFSYTHQDRILRDHLEDHLSILKHRGFITTWHAGKISMGEEVTQQIDIYLNTADIILLLISAYFMASQPCYNQQMARAMQRHERGDADVLPVLLRPVMITDAPFAHLEPLPSNGIPVVEWRIRDRAFANIASGIARVVYTRLSPPDPYVYATTPPISERFIGWLPDGEEADGLRQELYGDAQERERAYYESALRACERALRRNNRDATAYRGKGHALAGLGRYSEALTAFDQAAVLAPLPLTYVSVGDILTNLGRYNEAVVAYEQALALDASYASAYTGISEVFFLLGKQFDADYNRVRHIVENEKKWPFPPPTKQEQLTLLTRSVDEWNKWRRRQPHLRPDLSGVSLGGADLRWINFSRVDLSKTNLSGANLRWTNFSEANLSKANLSGANLSEADLGGANLSEADLSRADLSKTDLSKAYLHCTNLTESKR